MSVYFFLTVETCLREGQMPLLYYNSQSNECLSNMRRHQAIPRVYTPSRQKGEQ